MDKDDFLWFWQNNSQHFNCSKDKAEEILTHLLESSYDEGYLQGKEEHYLQGCKETLEGIISDVKTNLRSL